jgi:hypothetical protein
MTYLLCRNRVRDFARWKAVFASHQAAHQDAGLRLLNLWRSLEEPENIFFLFEVASLDRAREFIGNPKAAKAGEASGVLDGEYHFLEDTGGY